MIAPHRPLSNYERRQDFLRRHPDYYKLRRAKARAEQKARLEARQLEMQRAAELAKVARQEPLMLPAPVEQIEFVNSDAILTIADIEAMRANLERQRELVPLQPSVPPPPLRRRVA